MAFTTAPRALSRTRTLPFRNSPESSTILAFFTTASVALPGGPEETQAAPQSPLGDLRHSWASQGWCSSRPKRGGGSTSTSVCLGGVRFGVAAAGPGDESPLRRGSLRAAHGLAADRARAGHGGGTVRGRRAARRHGLLLRTLDRSGSAVRGGDPGSPGGPSRLARIGRRDQTTPPPLNASARSARRTNRDTLRYFATVSVILPTVLTGRGHEDPAHITCTLSGSPAPADTKQQNVRF